MNPRIFASLALHKTRILTAFAVLSLALFSACSSGSGKSTLDGNNPNLLGDGTPLGGGGGGGGLLGGGGGPTGSTGATQPPPGSNNDGSLSATDKNALNAAFGENNQVAPTGPAADFQIFTPDLAAQAKAILAAQRDATQRAHASALRLLFMTKMIARCAEVTGQYSPIPGQPLLGHWNGSGSCSVSFDVSGAGGGGKYAVSGGTSGVLQADQQGKGAIQANPFSGNVIDSPQSGTGQLTHPSFFQTKSGSSPCTVNVHLTSPTSPIPQNYKTAMQLMGKCLRNTAILINPVFDRMFQDLNPQLSQLLQDKFLSIK